MNAKQKRFALDYLEDLNATRAYLAVYKNCKTEEAAAACASRLLAKDDIKEFISERMKEIEDAQIADVKEVMKKLTSILRGDEITEQVPLLIGDGYQELTDKKPAFKDQLKAAELLGKRYGMFTENFNVESVIVNIGGEDELED